MKIFYLIFIIFNLLIFSKFFLIFSLFSFWFFFLKFFKIIFSHVTLLLNPFSSIDCIFSHGTFIGLFLLSLHFFEIFSVFYLSFITFFFIEYLTKLFSPMKEIFWMLLFNFIFSQDIFSLNHYFFWNLIFFI